MTAAGDGRLAASCRSSTTPEQLHARAARSARRSTAAARRPGAAGVLRGVVRKPAAVTTSTRRRPRCCWPTILAPDLDAIFAGYGATAAENRTALARQLGRALMRRAAPIRGRRARRDDRASGRRGRGQGGPARRDARGALPRRRGRDRAAAPEEAALAGDRAARGGDRAAGVLAPAAADRRRPVPALARGRGRARGGRDDPLRHLRAHGVAVDRRRRPHPARGHLLPAGRRRRARDGPRAALPRRAARAAAALGMDGLQNVRYGLSRARPTMSDERGRRSTVVPAAPGRHGHPASSALERTRCAGREARVLGRARPALQRHHLLHRPDPLPRR